MGTQVAVSFQDLFLSKSAPVILVYSDPMENSCPAPSFFAFSGPLSSPSHPNPFPQQRPIPNPIGDDSYFSCAPLGDVLSVQTFYDESSGLCRGIISRYQNGGARAVGQCRLHVDPAETVSRPHRLCLRAETSHSRRGMLLHGTRVAFRQHPEQEPLEESWECYALKGSLRFWFTIDSTVITLEN